MESPINPYGGYRKTLSFGLTCLVYHATTRFCKRVYDYKNDALGKASGQMVGAARSARQNIVEGSARAGISKETELKLYSVAHGSLEELAGDYEAYCVEHDTPLWSVHDDRHKTLTRLDFDPFTASTDVAHAFSLHTIAMRKKFAPWLEHNDTPEAANAIFITATRAAQLLRKQIEKITGEIIEKGGFRENLTRARLEQRDAPPPGQPAATECPVCPDCGKVMRQRTAKKGSNIGKPFWACTGFPACTGTRKMEGG